MFSWIFAKKGAPKRNESIKRVHNMLLAPRNPDKFYSPTLQQLANHEISNVKRLSSIYEENIAKENEKTLSNRLVDTPLTSRKFVPAFEKKNAQSDSKLLDPTSCAIAHVPNIEEKDQKLKVLDPTSCALLHDKDDKAPENHSLTSKKPAIEEKDQKSDPQVQDPTCCTLVDDKDDKASCLPEDNSITSEKLPAIEEKDQKSESKVLDPSNSVLTQNKSDKKTCNCFEKNKPLLKESMPSIEEKVEKLSPELMNLFKSFLIRDEKYTEWMERLMRTYHYELDFELFLKNPFASHSNVPVVFGNASEIYEMHIDKFQPFLKSFINDKSPDISTKIFNFAKNLISLCQKGTFNPYLEYAKKEKVVTAMRHKFYSDFLIRVERKHQIAYNFDPINQITQYEHLINEICKEAQRQKISLECVEKITYAMKEFQNEISKIKSARKK